MAESRDRFMGPSWARWVLGISLFGIGGVASIVLLIVLVAGFATDLGNGASPWPGVATLTPIVVVLAMATLAGWRVLRTPIRRRTGGGPPGWVWVTLGGLAMLPLLWVAGGVFLGPGPLPPQSGYVVLAWFLLFLLSVPVLKRWESARGGGIRWWEWGMVQGLLAGIASGSEIALAGRGAVPTVLGGAVIGALFFSGVGGYLLWWERIGRSWYLGQGGTPRWPLS